MKCVGLVSNGNFDFSESVSAIKRAMEVLFKRTHSRAEVTAFERLVLNMCRAAYKLRLLMRKARASYQVFLPERGISLEHAEDRLEVYGVEGEGEPGNKVAYTLFGGILLNSEDENQGQVILEKARVVVMPA
jgi:hypothetical protein